MKLWFFQILLSPGSGFLFSTLLTDLVLFLLICYITWKILFPVLRNYCLAKHLDRLCDTVPRHWFHGHLVNLGGFTEKGLLAMVEVTKKFPVVINTWIGPFLPQISIFHPDSARVLLSSGAPKSETAYRIIRPWIGDGLLTSSGKKWLRNRRLLTPAFHYNVLKPYLKIFNASAKVLMKKWEGQNCVEVSDDVSMMTLDTMLQCAMSLKSGCQNVTGKHPYIEAVQTIAVILMKRLRKPHLLIDFIFNMTSDAKILYHSYDVVHTQAEEIISTRRKALQNDEKPNRKHLDFIDILIETKDENGKGLTDREIRDEVDTFLFEGHDTTASGISWLFHNFAKYPELQEKCREEVLSVMGKREDVEWEDLTELPYTTMFIKESMRLYPPVPRIGRYLKEPLQLPTNTSTVTIPPNCNATLSIFVQHRNHQVWEEPERFDPERFNLENSANREPHAYIPFSAGPRNCIGQNFAMNEIKVAAVQALKSYQFYLDHQTPEPEMESKIILWSKSGILVKLKSLKSS